MSDALRSVISDAARAAARRRHPRRAILARSLFLAAALAIGLILAFGLGLDLHPAILWAMLGWYATVPIFFIWQSRFADRSWFFPVRFAFFIFEVTLIALASHLLGGAGWLAMTLLLFPAFEWNIQFPGRLGVLGSVIAVFAGGALAWLEASGRLPHYSLFASADSLYSEPGYLISTLLLFTFVLLFVSISAGNFAGALRRRRRELAALNAELQSTSDELERSTGDLESAHQNLQKAQGNLERSYEMASLGMLLKGLAHEFRTPLAALASNRDVLERSLSRLAEMLADDVIDESELVQLRGVVSALADVVKVDRTAVDHMNQLVHSVKTCGQPDCGVIEPVDVHERLEDTLTLLRHELKRHVTVVREFGELPLVECNPNQLNQVFINILLNAAQAMPEKGTITIRTSHMNGQVVVEIRDTGTGIEPEVLERIFEPGFSTKGQGGGMGLGLKISQQIVQRHGGRIDVESTVGEGSAFTVRLPARFGAVGSDKQP